MSGSLGARRAGTGSVLPAEEPQLVTDTCTGTLPVVGQLAGRGLVGREITETVVGEAERATHGSTPSLPLVSVDDER
jgi:hypothetical protein